MVFWAIRTIDDWMMTLSPVVGTGYMTGLSAAGQNGLKGGRCLTDDTREGGGRIQFFHVWNDFALGVAKKMGS